MSQHSRAGCNTVVCNNKPLITIDQLNNIKLLLKALSDSHNGMNNSLFGLKGLVWFYWEEKLRKFSKENIKRICLESKWNGSKAINWLIIQINGLLQLLGGLTDGALIGLLNGMDLACNWSVGRGRLLSSLSLLSSLDLHRFSTWMNSSMSKEGIECWPLVCWLKLKSGVV